MSYKKSKQWIYQYLSFKDEMNEKKIIYSVYFSSTVNVKMIQNQFVHLSLFQYTVTGPLGGHGGRAQSRAVVELKEGTAHAQIPRLSI